MGLNLSHVYSGAQLCYFGENLQDYTVLALDNRGVGQSDTPSGPYSIKEMAKDTLEVLGHLGWSRVHVVGISMGGMIAMELALAAPAGTIASLTLTSTHAGSVSLPSVQAVTTVPRILFSTSLSSRTEKMVSLLFPPDVLNRHPPDPKDDPYVAKMFEAFGEETTETFRTNRDYLAALFMYRAKLTRPQTVYGSLSQLYAAMTHSVSKDRLHALRDSGVPILVVTGTWDKMVDPKNSEYLSQQLGARLHVFHGAGHAMSAEQSLEYNQMLKTHFDKAEAA
ncbi:Alpha/Beta hydrolase protein [Cladochytrium replicatum]|nr:Alpha/Beta hydrolase protein [Cladochytrium replicatum]